MAGRRAGSGAPEAIPSIRCDLLDEAATVRTGFVVEAALIGRVSSGRPAAAEPARPLTGQYWG